MSETVPEYRVGEHVTVLADRTVRSDATKVTLAEHAQAAFHVAAALYADLVIQVEAELNSGRFSGMLDLCRRQTAARVAFLAARREQQAAEDAELASLEADLNVAHPISESYARPGHGAGRFCLPEATTEERVKSEWLDPTAARVAITWEFTSTWQPGCTDCRPVASECVRTLGPTDAEHARARRVARGYICSPVERVETPLPQQADRPQRRATPRARS